jgi:hypothetical protein
LQQKLRFKSFVNIVTVYSTCISHFEISITISWSKRISFYITLKFCGALPSLNESPGNQNSVIPGPIPYTLHIVQYTQQSGNPLLSHVILIYLRAVIAQSVQRLGYGLDDRDSRVWFPGGGWDFFLHQRVQNGSEAHAASCPMCTRASFPGGRAAGAWSWPLTSM